MSLSGVVNGSNRCRFDLTPPRHFLYPAILLLLIEQPRHGYRLVDALLALGFGPVDRPGVYRALSDLEHDGLLDSWSATPIAGSIRHVYGVTPAGTEALDRWMRVIAAEREALDGVLLRYFKVAPHSIDCLGVGRLGHMRLKASRGDLLDHVPPSGATLDRDRD